MSRVTECWCCGRDPATVYPGWHSARGLCGRCYNRWQQRGFTGPGPGPEFMPAAGRARDYEHVITSLSARLAAQELGVSARTVQRWRRALREVTPCQN